MENNFALVDDAALIAAATLAVSLGLIEQAINGETRAKQMKSFFGNGEEETQREQVANNSGSTSGATPSDDGGPGNHDKPTKNSEKLHWDSWENYEKIHKDGKEYAKIGDRVYTRHAVDRMQPSTLGNPAGQTVPGRNISPNMVEEIIQFGTNRVEYTPQGIGRTIFSSGNFEVITEQAGKIVVTIKRVR